MIWGWEEDKGRPGGRNCKCKGPEVGHSLVLSKAERRVIWLEYSGKGGVLDHTGVLLLMKD